MRHPHGLRKKAKISRMALCEFAGRIFNFSEGAEAITAGVPQPTDIECRL